VLSNLVAGYGIARPSRNAVARDRNGFMVRANSRCHRSFFASRIIPIGKAFGFFPGLRAPAIFRLGGERIPYPRRGSRARVYGALLKGVELDAFSQGIGRDRGIRRTLTVLAPRSDRIPDGKANEAVTAPHYQAWESITALYG